MRVAFISNGPGLVNLMPKWTSKADCIEAWSLVLDADHLSGISGNQQTWDSLNGYDVILVNQNTSMYELTWKIKEHCPSPFLIAIANGCARDMAKFNSQALYAMVQAAQACDMYGTLIDWTIPNYELITTTPVRWIGLPFYPEFFEPHKIEPSKKDSSQPIIGLQNSLCNMRNGLISLLIAGSIKPAKILLPYLEAGWEDVGNRLRIDNIDLSPASDWPEFLHRYRQAYFCVHLDTLYTFGRFPLDMAALGIPVIGSNRNQTNKVLWPQLTIDPVKDIAHAKELARRLIDDKDFYTQQILSGTAGLAQFSPAITKERLLALIKDLSNT